MANPSLVQLARIYEQSLPFVTVRFGAHAIRLAVPNQKCLSFAATLHNREPVTNRWIANFRPDEVFFDVGANNGIYSLIATVCQGCRSIAFEPHFASFYVLYQNIFANKVQDRVTAYQLALADEEGFGQIFLSATTAGKSLNQFGAAHPSDQPLWHATIPQGCVSTTLDAFVARTGTVPNHVKIDVDGLEGAIISASAALLRAPELQTILVETTTKADIDAYVATTVEGAGFVRMVEEGGNTIWARPDVAPRLRL